MDGMNINGLNIREAVFAAVASFDYTVEKATLSSSSGLALVLQKGASEEDLLRHGESAVMPCILTHCHSLNNYFFAFVHKLSISLYDFPASGKLI